MARAVDLEETAGAMVETTVAALEVAVWSAVWAAMVETVATVGDVPRRS